MGEICIQLQTPGSGITVHFYGVKPFQTEPLLIPVEQRITCEEVCMQSAQHLSKNLGRYFPRDSERKIGPLLLPLFGLYAEDHALQQWVSDWFIFDPNQAPQSFYFRIRVQPPATESFLKKIPQGVFADYLFWQCAQDFLTGRIWQQTENQINTLDKVNINAIRILMASAGYHMHDVVTCDVSRILHTPLKNLTWIKNVLNKVTYCSVRSHLPASMSPELCAEYNFKGNPLMRKLTCDHFKKYIKQFFETNGEICLRELRLLIVYAFIKDFVPNYGMETFSAEKMDRVGLPRRRVELIIRPYQDGCSPGVYFNTKLVTPLQDILRVFIADSETTSEKPDVVMECRNQPPLVLQMANQELAESFISVLDTYYRLKVCYHSSPRDDRQKSPSLRRLEMLRSYGPMLENVARQHLRTRKEEDRRFAMNACYLIYEDCQEFGLMHIVGTSVDTNNITSYDIRYRQAACESGVTFFVHSAGMPERLLFETSNPKELIMHLNTHLMKGLRICPKEEEICGAMYYLQDELTDDHYYSSVMENNRMTRKTAEDASEVPMLFREDQVSVNPNTDLVVRGEFCDVFRFKQIEQGREAILKMVTDKKPAVQEAYRKGAEQLMKLGESFHLFIKVYGFMVTSPLRIIFESMPQGKGSLLRRLRDPKSAPIHYMHVHLVLRQLADCMHFLEKKKLIYGSLCCAKILILSEEETVDEQHFTIRLGDPSIDLYFDTLPLIDTQNQRRLPWVALERFDDLSKHTVASMVYSLGTTLWELLSLGQHPIECIPAGINVAHFFKYNQLPTAHFIRATGAQGETSNNAEGEIKQSTGGKDDARTREWVDSQNFQANPDTEDSHYMLAAATSSDDSTQTSGETAQASGETVETELSGKEVHNPREDSLKPLIELQQYLVQLIHDCWHRDPDQRPSATDLQKRDRKVRTLLLEAQRCDLTWQQAKFLHHALLTGNVNNREEAEKLMPRMKHNLCVKTQEQKEEHENLLELEAKVRNEIKCSIMHTRLDFTSETELGKGNFGKVVKAKLKPDCETKEEEERCEKKDVAVKMIHDTITNNDEVSRFLKEALCIYHLKHPNVVELIGIVMKGLKNSYMLVMELADMGSLDKFVHKKSHSLGMQTFKLTLKKLAIDIAKGLEYFCQQKNRLHGDLAARNILLFGSDGPSTRNITAKLGDFGLSHEMNGGYYDLRKSKTKSHRLPVYSLPPETLKGYSTPELRFTIKTDVWSFGIVLWEMFSGKRPDDFLNPSNPETPSPSSLLKRYLEEKYRLPELDNFPRKMYEIMQCCWQESPGQRPDFTELRQQLEDLTDNDMA